MGGEGGFCCWAHCLRRGTCRIWMRNGRCCAIRRSKLHACSGVAHGDCARTLDDANRCTQHTNAPANKCTKCRVEALGAAEIARVDATPVELGESVEQMPPGDACVREPNRAVVDAIQATLVPAVANLNVWQHFSRHGVTQRNNECVHAHVLVRVWLLCRTLCGKEQACEHDGEYGIFRRTSNPPLDGGLVRRVDVKLVRLCVVRRLRRKSGNVGSMPEFRRWGRIRADVFPCRGSTRLPRRG